MPPRGWGFSGFGAVKGGKGPPAPGGGFYGKRRRCRAAEPAGREV